VLSARIKIFNSIPFEFNSFLLNFVSNGKRGILLGVEGVTALR
jgi:hypothetical protein